MSADPGALVAFDRERSGDERRLVCGVDEAGRGCLAGPVTAGAVILPPGWCPEGLDDSKRLDASRRESLYDAIVEGALSWGAFDVSAAEIDRVNILQATMLAMVGAVDSLATQPDLVLVDGNRLPRWEREAQAVIGGDGLSASVAAASIIAKVTRDRLMTAYDAAHPGYGFAGHKGYGSAEHLAALRRLGPCPIHRRTFRPVAQLGQGRLW